MEPLPICPACGADVQPHWERCAACGYEPGATPDGADAGVAAGVTAPGMVDPLAQLSGRYGDDLDDPYGDEPVVFDLGAPLDDDPYGEGPATFDPSGPDAADPGSSPTLPAVAAGAAAAFPRGPVQPDEILPPGPPPPGGGSPFAGGGAPPPFVPASELAARSSSPFGMNKVVVVVVSIIGVLVLLGGIAVLTSGGTPPPDYTSAPATRPSGTSKPVKGLAGVAESTTIPAPTTPPSTVGGSGAIANCDSRASVHSANGKGTVPCGGGFSVDFAGRPEIVPVAGSVALGPVSWTKLTSTDPDVTRQRIIRYAVVFGELPADPSPEDTKEALAAAAGVLGGTSSGTKGFQGYEGITFKGRDEEWVISGVAFVNGRKVVALAAMGLDGLDGDELDQFGQTFVWLP